jgi:uncharacterized protein YjbI with pentapeptide repeats
MANKEHVDILMQGVEVWNKWREEHPEIEPDLCNPPFTIDSLDSIINLPSGLNFSGANLSRANLRNVILLGDLSHANLQNVSFLAGSLQEVDLSGADLSGADLNGVGFSNVDFNDTNLSYAKLNGASFSQANLNEVNFTGADLTEANFLGANLTRANLSHADLRRASLSTTIINDIDYYKLDPQDIDEMNYSEANLQGANLAEADLREANLSHVILSHAYLQGANLSGANLTKANLAEADLSGANLSRALLVQTELANANLTGCRIYGISAWDVHLENAIQKDLTITPLEELLLPSPNLYPGLTLYPGKSEITSDHLEVAQFIYLLLNNQKIRDVINAITSKVVLILGRFTDERKQVLDALRNELRNYNFSPVVFDFDPSAKRDLTETISILAHMSRFVIADLTDAKSIPQELQAIVPHLPSVPIQPILQVGTKEYTMFEHYERYPWVLPIYRYQDIPSLLASIKERIITPVELKEYEKEKTKALEEEIKKLREENKKLREGR